MLLPLLHPEVAYRDCEHCQKFSYDEDTGQVRIFDGRELPRDKAERPPCRTSVGCPKGTPEQQSSHSVCNWLCYRHYLRCVATGRFPDDPLVAANAVIIMEAEREAWERKQLAAISRPAGGLPSGPYVRPPSGIGNGSGRYGGFTRNG